MGTIVITGSAGGIGQATRARLEADGHRIIGVDMRDAEVLADLSTPEGRHAMVAGVEVACGGVLDGLLVGAGISSNGRNEALVVSVNYFGAVATLEGLRPMLARGTDPAVVAISSNSTTTQQGLPTDVVALCLAGDEAAATAAAPNSPMGGYPASKMALAHWARTQATKPDWVGAGIRLNVIAPGAINTPMTTPIAEMIMGLGDVFPMPMGRIAEPTEVASLVAYLLGPESRFFCGSFICMDGGTDAATRATDWPAPRP
jgi:NAD(P)-dependent dehydrogenase (short-subunit alcohol dehydrogenase family)